MIELKNSKTTYLGKGSSGDKYSLDAFIGAVQIREPEGQWQDIKPCLVRDSDGWHIEGAPYYAEIKDDGSRLFCPDRNERSKYLRLPTITLLSGLARNVVSNPNKLDNLLLPNQITMPTAWGEIRIIFSNTGMHFEILFREAPPSAVFGKDSSRILIDAETVGYDIEQLLKSTSGIGIPRPRLISANLEALMSENQDKWLDWNYKNGQLELGFDFGDLPFPILLKNTTLEVQVSASSDDCYRRLTTSYFSLAQSSTPAGATGTTTYQNGSGMRFTNVTIPQGGTIDNGTYLIFRAATSQSGTVVRTRISAEDVDDAPTFANDASAFDTRWANRTTARVDWDSIPAWVADTTYNSPEIKTVIQEIVDRAGWASGNDIVIFWDDFEDRSTHANYCYRNGDSYESSSPSAPTKLHIEYTAGGATAKTSAETGSGADGSSLLASMARGDTGGGSESATARSLVIKDDGGGVDALTALIAAVLASETGSGVEQSTLTSLVAKLSAETGSGIDIAGLAARLVSSEVGLGVDTGMILGLKSIFSGDGGIGYDALKALIETSGAGSDMKLPGRLGQVRIPSKGVSL